MPSFKKLSLYLGLFPVLLALPASTNYEMDSLFTGSGGGEVESTNYKMELVVGEPNGTGSGTDYDVNTGMIYTQEANVTHVNPTNLNEYGQTDRLYNKLKLNLNQANNPDDTTYAIKVSPDNWVTTKYIEITAGVLYLSDTMNWYSYSDFGGATGKYLTGLQADTTYKFKVKSEQGDYTEGPWGPETSALTVSPQLSFDIDIGTDSSADNSTPYVVDVGQIDYTSVTTATNKVYYDLDTNAENGATINVRGNYQGLYSGQANYTINSESEQLITDTNANDGYGLGNGSFSNTYGTWVEGSTYDTSGNYVGALTNSFDQLASTNNDPITGGRGEAIIKAVASKSTPAAVDYSDVLTFQVIGNY